ncbi:MAG: malonyl-CoA decarboxylase N-terminal domain-containing protein, partial [Alphaproteobacteria bacterium]|nr:malonyl-CoA decarboxylase N-terminal domain-containing protein [Alphaproteobacteria bacterium]
MDEQSGLGILGRLKNAWREITAPGSDVGELVLSPELPESETKLLKEQMNACLQGVGGEVSARGRAAQLGRAYLALDDTGRERFLSIMAKDFGPDKEKIDAAAQKLIDADEDNREAAEKELKKALIAPRHRLLTQFNALPDGVKFLVDMRA